MDMRFKMPGGDLGRYIRGFRRFVEEGKDAVSECDRRGDVERIGTNFKMKR